MSVLIEPVRDTQMAEKLRSYTADYNWITDNYSELAEQFTDNYVAVKNKDVKYHAETMEELISIIVSKRDTIAEYVIEYVTNEETALLL